MYHEVNILYVSKSADADTQANCLNNAPII